jgi:hypothetical protein
MLINNRNEAIKHVFAKLDALHPGKFKFLDSIGYSSTITLGGFETEYPSPSIKVKRYSFEGNRWRIHVDQGLGHGHEGKSHYDLDCQTGEFNLAKVAARMLDSVKIYAQMEELARARNEAIEVKRKAEKDTQSVLQQALTENFALFDGNVGRYGGASMFLPVSNLSVHVSVYSERVKVELPTLTVEQTVKLLKFLNEMSA